MKKINFGTVIGTTALGVLILNLAQAVVKTVQTETSSTTKPIVQTAVEGVENQETASVSLKDGTYTGELISTNRGDVQVQMTVSSGKIASLDVIEYPQDNPNSQSINENALPIYTQAALEAQSASIDLVSGASETYKGFTGSLQDAINQAQA